MLPMTAVPTEQGFCFCFHRKKKIKIGFVKINLQVLSNKYNNKRK